MRPLLGVARAAANAVGGAEPGGGRATGRLARVLRNTQKSHGTVRAATILAKAQPQIVLEPLPLRGFIRDKFPRLAAKFANYRAISGTATPSARLFKPFANVNARIQPQTGGIRPAPFVRLPTSSSVLGYAPALPGRMHFSSVANIARARFASDSANASYGWAKWGAFGLLLLKKDEDGTIEKVDLCVNLARTSSKRAGGKSRKIGGIKSAGIAKKSTQSKYFGQVRNATAGMNMATPRTSYKELMRQAAWRCINGDATALTISLFGYGVWDLEGFIPTSMLWRGAYGTIPITDGSLDCLRRALDQDGTLAKTVACLEEFYFSGELNEVLAEIHESGEITLKLVFPPKTDEGDVRQRLYMLGVDPDDHIFEFTGPETRHQASLDQITSVNVIFVAPGPPHEMEFDEWESGSVASSESLPESWLDVPPSENRRVDFASFRPDESAFGDHVWEQV